MEEDQNIDKFQQILDGVDLPENMKNRAIETELEAHRGIMDKIIDQQWTVSEEKVDINLEIRKLHLADAKHKWEENVKITQAKHDKWGKKEYLEKLANITHNYQYLADNISEDTYEEHFDMISKVQGYDDKIETLILIYEKKKEREEKIKNMPKPKSFLSKIEKRNKKLEQKKYKTDEQITEERRKKRQEAEKEIRLKKLEEAKEKRLQEQRGNSHPIMTHRKRTTGSKSAQSSEQSCTPV